MKKITIAVLFGGRSQEHEVSIVSASHIIESLRTNKRYTIIPVGVTKTGEWLTGNDLIGAFMKGKLSDLTRVHLRVDGSRMLEFVQKNRIVRRTKIDLVFPWILGPNGEDGTLQGLLEIADIPYAGCGVFASAAGFNKALTKIVLTAAGIPQVPYVTFSHGEWQKNKKNLLKEIGSKLHFPCFVKPASCGSSIGISKVKKASALAKAVTGAFLFDTTVVVEKGVQNMREIETAVLGTPDDLTVSLPGEVHYDGEFYDYNAKYVSKYWEIDIPPKLPAKTIEKIRAMAANTFRAIQGAGIARIDFLMDDKTGAIYLNELNTVPSFRKISCYATLMAKVGVSYKQIIERLIKIGFAVYAEKKKKKLDFADAGEWFKKQ